MTAEKIAGWFVVCEKKTLVRVGLTEKEQIPLEELGLSMRAFNICRRYTCHYRHSLQTPTYWDSGHYLFWNIEANLPSIEEAGTLAMRTEKELLGFRNLGKISVEQIKQKLSELGLSLATVS